MSFLNGQVTGGRVTGGPFKPFFGLSGELWIAA